MQVLDTMETLAIQNVALGRVRLLHISVEETIRREEGLDGLEGPTGRLRVYINGTRSGPRAD